MPLHGFMAKAVPTVITGTVGFAAYEVLRKGVAKLPLRAATVTATAWGIRVVHEAERKAAASAGRARLSAADVIAEAKERIGEDVTPGPAAVHPGHVDDH
ncbi:DUF1490 family protein [Mycobacterium gastri]|uniref:DUF1490 family protein n=1 Tax=Mycobacterium gastri TaxID=1777 RepID=UPI00111C6013|nr:DUF1490 family protein [Mycobacterium gastri]